MSVLPDRGLCQSMDSVLLTANRNTHSSGLGTVPESCCCPCWEEKVASFGRSPSQAVS
ncbi:Uncharacterized protein DAT39_000052 [Clarias magur]|uniref:Uncharacterized protein n=1 Tax=Clarias magur TaxID=1594786 RepID=A0A8J5CG94_CLAMG|nr:Uncharacterized protein DAT39_000052 [Clarias magur]